jgi:hypothetical protein
MVILVMKKLCWQYDEDDKNEYDDENEDDDNMMINIKSPRC